MARIDLKFLDVYNERDGVNDYIKLKQKRMDLYVTEGWCGMKI